MTGMISVYNANGNGAGALAAFDSVSRQGENTSSRRCGNGMRVGRDPGVADQGHAPPNSNFIRLYNTVRWIGEQHVREDCQGRIPSMADWLRRIQPEPWMANGHIDRHSGDEPCGDPRAAWASEVVAGRTVLGLKDWMAARATQATQGA